ncbi:MAG: hypothetical protein SP4CHLAM5_02670 [Chlamydiia bacterium]|nr:hypothetical protein [Chlamydiia bacterium]MCH9618141.1 hypothetical protein [Chlamydiia bacterium]
MVAHQVLGGIVARARIQDVALKEKLKVRIADLVEQFQSMKEQAEGFDLKQSVLRQMEASYTQHSSPISLTDTRESLEEKISLADRAYDTMLLLFAGAVKKRAKDYLKKLLITASLASDARQSFSGLKDCDRLEQRYQEINEVLCDISSYLEDAVKEFDHRALMERSFMVKRIEYLIEQMDKEFICIRELCEGTKKYFEVFPGEEAQDFRRQHVVRREVIRDKIVADPYKELIDLSNFLNIIKGTQKLKNVRLRITFKGEDGFDTGGLTQEYFYLLFTGISKGASGSRRGLFEHDHRVSRDENIYSHLSFLLRYAYEKERLYIGKHFDHKDLRVLFGFSSDVMSVTVLDKSEEFWKSKPSVLKEFLNRQSEVVAMVEAIIATNSESFQKSYLPIVELLAVTDSKECSDLMLECLFAEKGEVDEDILTLKKTNGEEFLIQVKYLAVGMLYKMIRPYRSRIRSLMRAFTAIDEASIRKLKEKLSEEEVKLVVRARLNKFFIQGTDSVSEKIQGRSNREAIIKSMRLEGEQTEPFKQKVAWFKEWAQEASEKEWEAFLVFATGANCDFHSNIVLMSVENESSLLTAYTCFGKIEFYEGFIVGHDDTKERFIGKIMESIATKDFAFL